MVLLQFWVFVWPPHPPFGNFLCHPALMACSRTCVRVGQVQLHAQQCAVSLPLRCVLPRGLTVVSECLAVGSIHFVAHSGNLIVCHKWRLVKGDG